MQLTKSKLKQIIKEEMQKILNEGACKTFTRGRRGKINALLWQLLQKNSRNRDLFHWKEDLDNPEHCPSSDDVIDAAMELMASIHNYWQTTAPKHLGLRDIKKIKECWKSSHEQNCKSLKKILYIENREYFIVHNKRKSDATLRYLQNFMGNVETAKITQKYPLELG